MGVRWQAAALVVLLGPLAACGGGVDPTGTQSGPRSATAGEGALPAPPAANPAPHHGEGHNDGLPAAPWTNAHTQVLMIGVLSWQDPTLATYPVLGRKDRELQRAFVERGVPEGQVTFVEDGAATHQAMRRALEDALARVGKDDTFVFYYAGHGMQAGAEVYLANYDVDSERTAETGFPVQELRDVFARSFHGARLLLLGDFCRSGALAKVAEDFAGTPVQAAAITSATRNNLSTGEWTYTEALIRAFRGEAALDHNADGALDYDEVSTFVASEMRYRAVQLSGAYRSPAWPANLSFATRAGAVVQPLAGRSPFDYVERLDNGTFQLAQIESVESGGYVVRDVWDPDRGPIWLAPDQVREPVPAADRPVGSRVDVMDDEVHYPAVVLATDHGFHFVHYDDWGPEWDEWVHADVLRDGTPAIP